MGRGLLFNDPHKVNENPLIVGFFSVQFDHKHTVD